MKILNIKKILIVEDEEFSCEFLKQLLSLKNYAYLETRDGLSAVNIIKREPDIHLVLMDIMLPVLNGIDAMQQIKKIRPEIPVIAQTAQAMKGDKEKYLHYGFDDYISKPIKIDEILEKISKHLTVSVDMAQISN